MSYDILHDALDKLMGEMTEKGIPQETVGIVVDGVPIVIITVTLNISPESLAVLDKVRETTLPATLPEDIDQQMRDLKPTDMDDLDKP